MEHLPWPLLALWALISYRKSIESLFERVEEFYGAKLRKADQPTTTQEPLEPVEQLTGLPQDSVAGARGEANPDTLEKKVALGVATLDFGDQNEERKVAESTCREDSYFDRADELPVPHHSIQREMERVFAANRQNSTLTRAESERSLTFQVAVTSVIADFRATALTIYGTQFRLLEALYKSTYTEAEAKTWLYRISEDNRDQFYVAWIGYLVDRGLVYREKDGSVSATDKGRDFVDWERRTAQNLSSRPH